MRLKAILILSLFILATSLLFFKSVLLSCGRLYKIPIYDGFMMQDYPLQERILGKLGIVRSGMSSRDLIIAYRYLSGLNLDEQARAAILEDEETRNARSGQKTDSEILRRLEKYEKGFSQAEAIHIWNKNRALVTGVVESIPVDDYCFLYSKIGDTYEEYARVNYHAVFMAASHLELLLKEHGPSDPGVEEWVRGQQMVFSIDWKKTQIPQPVQTPGWLRADREYQIAAALFYSEHFEEAADAFSKISLDESSPWRFWAAYLQARCWVRQAYLAAAKELQDPDISLLLKAQYHLEEVLKNPVYAPVHSAAESYLDFIRHRTEPRRMVEEALREFLEPVLHDHFSFLFRRYQDAEQTFSHKIRYKKEMPSELWPAENTPGASFHRWLLVMDAIDTEINIIKQALDKALAGWKEERSLPWLVAVLNYLPPGHPQQEEMLAEAASISASSPASMTLAWHLLRLKTAELPAEERKAKLEEAIEHSPFPEWSKNYLRTERRGLAGSLEEWLRFAPLRIVGRFGDGGSTEPDLPWAFEDSVAGVFDRMSLDQLITSVRSNILPTRLLRTVAHVAWVRAAFLKDWDKAEILESFLEERLQTAIHKEVLSKESFERRFELATLLLSFPGLNIHVEPGYGRDPEDIKEYCDYPYLDWWKREDLRKNGEDFSLPAFWRNEDIEKAKEEYAALTKDELAIDIFGQAVIAFAKANPKDMRVPRALHLIVKATQRYRGMRTSLSRQAFRLLHYRYPKSPWTQETPYYY